MFIDTIHKLLKEKGVTQKEFLQSIGLSKNTLKNWEDNNTIPSKVILTAISNYFNVSVPFLLGETEDRSAGLTTDEENSVSSPDYEVFIAYQNASPEIKAAIRKILDL